MHASDDLLAGAALGDELPEVQRQHLADCPACQQRLDEFNHLIEVGRTLTADDAPAAPSDDVWAAISGELGLGAGDEQVAQVIPIGSRRRRWSTSWLVAAVAAGVVVGGVATAIGEGAFGNDAAPVAAPPPVVAEASLTALPEKRGSGRAEIVDTPDGPELVVDVSDLTAGDGFYEVWLIDPKTFEMVGLGALTTDEGRFPIPDGLDLSQYRVVDVSIEPFDGDPVHSRDSVVRGELDV